MESIAISILKRLHDRRGSLADHLRTDVAAHLRARRGLSTYSTAFLLVPDLSWQGSSRSREYAATSICKTIRAGTTAIRLSAGNVYRNIVSNSPTAGFWPLFSTGTNAARNLAKAFE
jgi:hypothetical protein